MSKPRNYWLVPLLIGLVIGVAAAAVLGIAPAGLVRARVAAEDALLVHAGGPRLGAQAAREDIVIVEIGTDSARRLGGLPDYQTDLRVYAALLQAEAKLVADTRMIAEYKDEEASGLAQLLDGMAAIDLRGGRLLRDIWMPNAWTPRQLARFRPYVGHQVLNMHPNADPVLGPRLYPLLTASADGVHETLPLKIARAATGQTAPPQEQILHWLRTGGTAAAWKRGLDGSMQLPPQMQPEADEVRPYPFGAGNIPWETFASVAPLVPPAGYWISYAVAPSDYQRVSFADVLEGKVSAAGIAGKIAIVGYAATLDPTSDTYAAPSSPTRASAAEITAIAVQTLMDPALSVPWSRKAQVITVILLCLGMALINGMLKPLPAVGGGLAALCAYLGASVIAFRSGYRPELLVVPLSALLAGAAAGAYRYVREDRSRRRIVDLFGRYVPRAVVAQLVQQPEAEALAVGGIKREVTVMFADIRGFTTFSERFAPEDVLSELNALLQIMVDCTFEQEGTVDKFIGDAILVLFNAPLAQPDHALRAARAAWAIQMALKEHPSGLGVGIGIHRGEAVVGTVGTPKRMEYTAIGSTVNLASRLCSTAEGGQVIVSDEVAGEISKAFRLQARPPVRVKGIDRDLITHIIVEAQ